MKSEMTKKQTLCLRKIKAREKIENIERKMVSLTEDGSILFSPLSPEELRTLLVELRKAEDEYRIAAEELINYMTID